MIIYIERNIALDQTFQVMYYTCNLKKNSLTYVHVKIVTLIWIQIQNGDPNDINLVIWNMCLNVSFLLMYRLLRSVDNVQRYGRMKNYLDKEENLQLSIITRSSHNVPHNNEYKKCR